MDIILNSYGGDDGIRGSHTPSIPGCISQADSKSATEWLGVGHLQKHQWRRQSSCLQAIGRDRARKQRHKTQDTATLITRGTAAVVRTGQLNPQIRSGRFHRAGQSATDSRLNSQLTTHRGGRPFESHARIVAARSLMESGPREPSQGAHPRSQRCSLRLQFPRPKLGWREIQEEPKEQSGGCTSGALHLGDSGQDL